MDDDPQNTALNDDETDEVPAGDVGDLYRTFTDQPIALIGSPTSDGRMLAADIDLSFRSFPLPLMWCKQSSGGHTNSYTIGVIESARIDGSNVLASGYLLNSPEADEASYQNAHGVSNPSVDLAAAEYTYVDDNGNQIDDLWSYVEDTEKIPVMMFTKAELIGTTLVSTPAFDTRLSLNSEREPRDVALVASAATEFQPKVYDPRLFENPNLTQPTLPSMGEDGRIYGHLAVFGQCHRSIQTDCILVPRSPSNYAHFHTSPALRMTDGSRLPVGRLTVGTGHADPRLGAAPAAAHYDNTGACFALVRVGEDSHGIWFSGVAAPWATAEQIEQGIASPMSGDWRNLGQGLDLIAVLAINTPGFAARGRDDDQGRPIALVASVGPSPKAHRRVQAAMTKDDLRDVVKEAFADIQAEAELASRKVDVLARAEKLVGKPKTPRDRIGDILASRN